MGQCITARAHTSISAFRSWPWCYASIQASNTKQKLATIIMVDCSRRTCSEVRRERNSTRRRGSWAGHIRARTHLDLFLDVENSRLHRNFSLSGRSKGFSIEGPPFLGRLATRARPPFMRADEVYSLADSGDDNRCHSGHHDLNQPEVPCLWSPSPLRWQVLPRRGADPCLCRGPC